jgi:hypothetical protein
MYLSKRGKNIAIASKEEESRKILSFELEYLWQYILRW